MEPITHFRGKNRWLSNFHECEIEYRGVKYPSTEHAYQAQKTTDLALREAIATIPLAKHAAKIGRRIIMRDDWPMEKRIEEMYEINLVKFTTHRDLGEKLLATGDAHLEEGNNWGDTFWGTVDGVGENHLGKVLMEVRETLREISS